MKKLIVIVLFAFVACKNNPSLPTGKTDTIVIRDTVYIQKPPSKIYSNERFKDVTVEKVATNKFFIKGKAQVFEATFNWVIEDGHNELKKGFEMTDAGAPAWGNFGFVVTATKARPNSTLHIILFEVSAKNGNRQYQLPILLY